MDWLAPLLAGTLATLFTLDVARQYRERGRAHQLAWLLGLAFYALASFIEVRVAWAGWTSGLYRLYFPAVALLVGLLGLGTMYLVPDRRVAHGFAVLVAVLAAIAAWGALTGRPDPTVLDAQGVDAGLKALGGAPRAAAALLNITGGIALIGGALVSWRHSKNRGVLLIGLGAVLPFTGGSLSSLGALNVRILFQLLGIAVIYAGFKLSYRGATKVHGRPA